MQNHLVITKVEIDEIIKMLPSDEAQRVLSFIDALKVFDRATDKKRCAAEMAARLEPLGYKGLSLAGSLASRSPSGLMVYSIASLNSGGAASSP